MTVPTRTRRSVVLTETVNGLTPVLMLFSIFLTLRGHNAPGGGFSGGLVMGSAVVLRYLAAGPRGLRSLRIDPIVLIGTGLLIAVVVGLTSLFADGSFQESAIWKFDVAILGDVKIVSSSLFDIGVHVLVVGVVMAVVVALAEADDEMRGRT
jgi:multisubunit Na+/H+ antiporter MnhB subunit